VSEKTVEQIVSETLASAQSSKPATTSDEPPAWAKSIADRLGALEGKLASPPPAAPAPAPAANPLASVLAALGAGSTAYTSPGSPSPSPRLSDPGSPTTWNRDDVARFRADGSFKARVEAWAARMPGGTGSIPFRRKVR
jgi:hypothetical protein